VDIHSRLLRYFTWKSVGDVDIERPQAGVMGEREADGVMPGWFLSLCDTGAAIEKLKPIQRRAVENRWRIAVSLEQAQRDVLVISMGATVRRADSLNDAMERVERLKRALRWWEENDFYRAGMSSLLRLFGRGGSGSGGVEQG
jgi:hypothetical protein